MSDPVATVLERSSGALTRPSSGVGRGRKGDRVDREKMLEVTLQQIEKQHGKGAVMKLGEHPMNVGMTTIPTGSLALDIALGVGGIPRGRVVEVFGPEGSGKTTVCLHIIAEAQRQGGIAAFIDAEHALDPTYARELGVDIDELLVSQPDSGEQALEIADMLVRSGAMHLVVIDSVAALVPRAEIEGEMGDTHVGLQARLMSQAMRKLAGSLSKFETTAIFINQLREQLGQGRENARAFLTEHIDLRDEIERKVREAVGLTGFSEEDDQPIQVVPDLVTDDGPEAKEKSAAAKE